MVERGLSPLPEEPNTDGEQSPLSPVDREIEARLFSPSLTLEEGLRIYGRAVAEGRAFLPAWEKRVLEIAVAAHPDRQDLVERLDILRGARPSATQLASQGNIVPDSKVRLAAAAALPSHGLPDHGKRWDAYARRIRRDIGGLTTAVDVLQFAQTRIGFEHRGNIHHEGKFTALYERELAVSYPHFADFLTGFSDIPDSAPDTTYEHKGRLISNVLYYLTRVIFSCLTHLPAAPRIILEVGGGYGAPARLWMSNPISRPQCYLILDMPESLFFADVFLRKEFGDGAVHYVNSDDPVSVAALERYHFILCPLARIATLAELPVDLVINTGSLQEMSEAWVGFYKDWLDRQRCRWFYSLNYFGQPVTALWESGNLYSPRLSAAWAARLLRWNPAFVRMQADRDFLEALYEKTESRLEPPEGQVLLNRLTQRCPTGEVLVEVMDLIRRCPDATLMIEALTYVMRIPGKPKEALWLAETLLARPISEADRIMIDGWRRELAQGRASGVEAYFDPT